jgi:hypothetical protein
VSEAAEAERGDSPPEEESPPSEAGAEAETERGGASGEVDEKEVEDLDYELRANSRAANRNVFSANTFYIMGDFKASPDGERALVPVADVTEEVAERDPAFVEPQSFQAIVGTLKDQRVAVLTGRHCGNRAAAGTALRASGHDPIFELPANLPVRELVNGIEELCGKYDAAGLLIHSLDPAMLDKLAGFELRRLRSVLAGRAAVAITVRADALPSLRARDLSVIAGIAPDPAAVLEKTAEARALSADDRSRAGEALAQLSGPVAPGTVVELIELAARVDEPAAALATIVEDRSPALDKWLQDRPTAQSVGVLAAAAALDGVPRGDFEVAAEELSRSLEGEVEGSTEEKRFGPTDHGLPTDLVEFGRATVSTHFGPQEAEVVKIASPHQADRIATYLWRQLSADFHGPYVEWLRDLATRPSGRVIKAAAITAGALFVADPLRVERELLQPWALDGRPRQRYCASLALGVPAATDADPLPARALAKTWAEDGNMNLLRTAVFAYGGPLGTWDTGAAATAHLWRIPEETPELQLAADRALASLATGGRGAARARAAVIGLLVGETSSKQVHPRAYSILPLLLSRLMAGDRGARESLAGLSDASERESLHGLAQLLARAFDAPTGQKSAMAAMRSVLAAIAAGRVDRDFLDLLIPMMRSAAGRRQRLPQFESQLARLLTAEGRRRGPLRDIARSTHDAFYAKQ